MDEPTPVRCPAPELGSTVDDEPLGLDELVARLGDPAPVEGALRFPRGTLQADGRLDLCKQDLTPADARRVIQAAVRSPHATHLLLGTNGLGAEGVAALADALGEGHQLRTLYLGCNHVDAAGVAPLADRLAGDRTVRAVWLKRNPIGDAGAATVAEALRGNPAVRTLDLTNTGIGPVGLRALVDALRSRPVRTERLYLGGNNLGPEAAELLVSLIRDAGVSELYVAAGRLGDAGALAIADGLAGLGRRVVLGLGGNGITAHGIRALAGRLTALSALDLARPPSAQALRSESNVVGDDGAAALARALPGSGLRRLDLRHTGVTGRGARLLLAALDEGSELELLGLGHGIPRRVKRAVTGVLRPETAPAEDVRAIASVYR